MNNILLILFLFIFTFLVFLCCTTATNPSIRKERLLAKKILTILRSKWVLAQRDVFNFYFAVSTVSVTSGHRWAACEMFSRVSSHTRRRARTL